MAKNRYLDEFMKTFPYEGLTYDDVTLVTQYADFLPDDTSLETQLTSRQKMNIPFISAAMDTVTEAPMAIAMALAGGIGVIHKNLENDEQAAQVAKVKNYLNGLIAKPDSSRSPSASTRTTTSASSAPRRSAWASSSTASPCWTTRTASWA